MKKSKDTCMKDEYGTLEQPARGFLCHSCKTIFHTKYALDRHTKIHSREKVLACEMCGKLLYNFVTLENIHPEYPKDRSLLNEVGEKLLKDEPHLKHVSRSKEIKAYVCEVCKHRSADEATFAMHCRQHKIKKPTFCYKCSQK
ncbi:hypothetical protein AVEN_88128-1 [Araneus ventricosus]|uniref:C2H2-type domain-containing protein n=1 Tax=Araneus ventricosus TaxID=182803 RepID=A0A4Y2P703_ARAVE|nr:hypothetical protein AVEN_88128-1 [Araneus ventricosus]